MLKLTLTVEQTEELERLERRGEPAHLREKAHALLLISQGVCAVEVARERLWRRRQPATIRHWVKTYKQDGVEGLQIKEGRGRKPLPFRRHAGQRVVQGADGCPSQATAA